MGVSDTSNKKTVKLYVRLPVKITDEQQIKDLHPGIIQVNLPRQKSARWCIVEFDSASVKAGIKALTALKVNNKKVYATVHKIKGSKRQ